MYKIFAGMPGEGGRKGSYEKIEICLQLEQRKKLLDLASENTGG